MSTPSQTKVGQNWVEESESESERSTATSKVKAEAGRGGTHIVIKCRSPTAEDVFFRIKRDGKMGRLVSMYCDKLSIDRHGANAFSTGGSRIRPEQTPDEIGLKDGGEIFVIPRQHVS